ncbi:M48 family metallopeptidase [Candidatus Pacearchaeota archaeon]|nr:M48 family metallopeptidase [Candidatus Pacearchaeota archaeon]
MQDRISFHDQIKRNKIKSVLLIFIIFAVLIALSYVIGMIYSGYFFFILIIGIIFSLSYTLISYYSSDKIALASVRAKPADYNQYRQLHNIVEGLCLASGMPKPKVYIMPGEQINAFATGRNPQNSVICVTEGALKKLTKQELEGVIGHELSHIANYDIRFMTLTAVMVGMIAIVSELFLRSLWFKGNDDNKKSGAILLLIGILLAILAPIVVQLVQFAISRKREYYADASAVKFTRSPTGLIQALKKIKRDSEKLKVSGAVAPLFISSPFKRLSNLTSTHPPLDERIRILERM